MKDKIILFSFRLRTLLSLEPNEIKVYLHLYANSSGLIPVYELNRELMISELNMTVDAIKSSFDTLIAGNYIVVDKTSEGIKRVIINTFDDDLRDLAGRKQFLYTLRGQLRYLKIKDTNETIYDKSWNAYIKKLQLLFSIKTT